MDSNKIFDMCIIGAGPAGMTAAIYAGRAGKSVAIVDKDGFGGNIAKSPKVENIPGFTSISGVDFASNMYAQMTSSSNVEHVVGEAVYLKYKHGLILTTLSDNQIICSKTLIIATGTRHRELKLDTKDIYYCVTCDGPFFKNKNVIVVGSGNTGATYALELAEYCKTVYICDVTINMCCEPILAKRIEENKKIHWLPNCTISGVKNDKDNKLTSINLSTYETIKVNAIFAAIGMDPQTEIVRQFAHLDDKGYADAKESCTTGCAPGVFVAGDCRSKKVRQVATAVADGATAAIEAIKFLRDNK